MIWKKYFSFKIHPKSGTIFIVLSEIVFKITYRHRIMFCRSYVLVHTFSWYLLTYCLKFFEISTCKKMVRTYGFEFNQSNWGTVSLQTRLFFSFSTQPLSLSFSTQSSSFHNALSCIGRNCHNWRCFIWKHKFPFNPSYSLKTHALYQLHTQRPLFKENIVLRWFAE